MPPVIPLYIFTARCTLVQSAVLRSHVVCPSVRLFVDCDHIGWNSSKIISRLVSMGRSLYEDLNIMDLLQGKQWTQSDPSPLIWASETFDRKLRPIAQRLQWRAYRKPSSLFWMVPSLTTPYNLPFIPKWGFHMPQYTLWPYLRNGWSDTLHVWSADRMALFPVTSNPSWRQAAILDNFAWPFLRNGSFDPLIYRAHRAVIFAIAQLSWYH